MLGIVDLPVFIAAAVALNLFPGPDTLYIVARSVSQGRLAGIVSALGISSGVCVHAVAAAVGLSAILANSAIAFAIVKWLGVAYLLYLGLRTLLQQRATATATPTVSSRNLWIVYRQGLLTNVFNPKVALFFMALLPQFVDPATTDRILPLLLLGAIFITTGTLWGLILATAAAGLSGAVRAGTTSLRRAQQAAGLVFIGLGLKLATEQTY